MRDMPGGQEMQDHAVHSNGDWEGIDLGGVGVSNVRPVNLM